MSPFILPPPLKSGDTIGVMAPSSHVDMASLEAVRGFAEVRGYKLLIHPQVTERLHQSAGTPAQKIAAFHDLLRDDAVRAIIGARGGNRAAGMLAGIDYDLVRRNPKIIMGYSDMTALLNGIHAKTGLVAYHGPVFREWLKRGEDMEGAMRLLTGQAQTILLDSAVAVRPAKNAVTGKLLGGNLSVLQSLIGTPYAPDFTGAILFIEDAGDHMSRYDRMLGHLRNAGILARLGALIVGDFGVPQDNPDNPFGFTLADIVAEHTAGYDYPVLMDAPFGHGARLVTLPVGQSATLDGLTLTLLA